MPPRWKCRVQRTAGYKRGTTARQHGHTLGKCAPAKKTWCRKNLAFGGIARNPRKHVLFNTCVSEAAEAQQANYQTNPQKADENELSENLSERIWENSLENAAPQENAKNAVGKLSEKIFALALCWPTKYFFRQIVGPRRYLYLLVRTQICRKESGARFLDNGAPQQYGPNVGFGILALSRFWAAKCQIDGRWLGLEVGSKNGTRFWPRFA